MDQNERELLDQKENNCWIKRRIPCLTCILTGRRGGIWLECNRSSQDRALRKRNLSGGGTSQLSDSATASILTGAVLLAAESFSTRVQCEKLSDSTSLTLFSNIVKKTTDPSCPTALCSRNSGGFQLGPA